MPLWDGAVCGMSGRGLRRLDFGAVTTPAGMDFSERLERIYDELALLLAQKRPDAMAVEKLYFKNNQKTAIDVAQARGMVLLAARKAGVPLYEYTPLQVKSAVTGYGKAEKPQVMEMTRRLLGLREVPKPDDTADALAIAICHGQTGRDGAEAADRRGRNRKITEGQRRCRNAVQCTGKADPHGAAHGGDRMRWGGI